MKKINFEAIPVKNLAGSVMVLNMKESLAELIYTRFGGLKYKLLAEKIYKSDGECELDERECELLAAVVAPESDYLGNKYSDAIREKLNVE